MEEIIKTNSKYLFINGFVLKIIAILTMTLDHLSQAMYVMYPYGNSSFITTFYVVGKFLGRLSLPIFCFLLVEGVFHTKNKNKYLKRLGFEALFISVFLLILYYLPINGIRKITASGNIFLDLFLGALMLFILKEENEQRKFLVLPIIIYSLISFIVKCFEYQSGGTILWFPDYLRMQYDWVSLALLFAFFFVPNITKFYFEWQSNYTGIDANKWEKTSTFRFASNLFSIGFIIIIYLIYYMIGKIIPQYTFYNGNISTFAIASSIFILFYNGKRGYNSYFFQIGCYIYYPLHLALIISLFAILWLR